MDPAFAAAIKLMMPAIENVMRSLGPEAVQGILSNGQEGQAQWGDPAPCQGPLVGLGERVPEPL
jgi:hypothetical protein